MTHQFEDYIELTDPYMSAEVASEILQYLQDIAMTAGYRPSRMDIWLAKALSPYLPEGELPNVLEYKLGVNVGRPVERESLSNSEPLINAAAGMPYIERRDYLENRTYTEQQPMTSTITNITRDYWTKKYKPLPNHLNKHSNNGMFETCGKDLKFVQSQPYNKVWTLTDSEDDNTLYIQSGIHFVNSLGYYVTEVPFEDDVIIQVF